MLTYGWLRASPERHGDGRGRCPLRPDRRVRSPAITSHSSTESGLISWVTHATGDVDALRVGETELSWCDTRGGHDLDLHTGEPAASPRACPETIEPDGSCSGLPIEVTVMTPGLGPLDVVWVDEWTFHPLGRVHDELHAVVEAARADRVGTSGTLSFAVVTVGSGRGSVVAYEIMMLCCGTGDA